MIDYLACPNYVEESTGCLQIVLKGADVPIQAQLGNAKEQQYHCW